MCVFLLTNENKRWYFVCNTIAIKISCIVRRTKLRYFIILTCVTFNHYVICSLYQRWLRPWAGAGFYMLVIDFIHVIMNEVELNTDWKGLNDTNKDKMILLSRFLSQLLYAQYTACLKTQQQQQQQKKTKTKTERNTFL